MLSDAKGRRPLILFCVWVITSAACGQETTPENPRQQVPTITPGALSMNESTNLTTATFGSGCFWCTEAVFQQIRGVKSVVSGYAGGDIENPSYEQVCSGRTGHAEVIQLKYDPVEVSYDTLLEVFWKTHDPTTLNRQGNDVGTQYRSVVMYHDDRQKELAEFYRKQLDESGAFSAPIVTEIVPAATFYPAEKYHQDYFNLNPRQPYCQAIVRPKVEKVREVFAEQLVRD